MEEVIQIEDRYYILATSALADDRTRVLKEGETFAVFDCHGDILSVGMGEEGIYHEGTRYLSGMELRLGQVRPLLLGSTINEFNELLAVDLMNPDFLTENGDKVHRDSVHIFRSKFLWSATCFEQLRITNFSLHPVNLPLTISFRTDFVDIFEVRGIKREIRGTLLEPSVQRGTATLAYKGLDGQTRATRLVFSPEPDSLTGLRADYRILLQPGQETTLGLTITCLSPQAPPPVVSYRSALGQMQKNLEKRRGQCCEIETSNEQFNQWLTRSYADLQMMLTETPHGLYPYAGVPWFSTAFGRDGLITAFESLWVCPDIARGTLAYLAATQATEIDRDQEAEPGKILHETRKGEMAVLREIPFGRYYGSVDSTPLFVCLAGAYYDRTGDVPFIQSIWSNIRKALEWMDTYGDLDNDGFLEYSRQSEDGLLQQGWKDSCDSVFHADGAFAEAPIALCEVQGYAYEARIRGGDLAEILGEPELAAEQRHKAEKLRIRFQGDFWCEEISTYALALDGAKNPCRVRSSNAGHCLFSGIAAPEHAGRLGDLLLSESFFTGWGVRTLAAGEPRYNPMSYHNGSIWPHDNALIAAGLARYGYTEHALKIMDGLFQTSIAVDLHRLPELFCGFRARPGLGPILYPLACSPQAWATASVFMVLQSALGLVIDGKRNVLSFRYPMLPRTLEEVRIRNLQVGSGKVDMALRRYESDVAVNVLHREGPVEVLVTK